MPIDAVQGQILRILARHRNPDSYVAGGIISAMDGARYSSDIDIFNSSSDSTLAAYVADRKVLEDHDFRVDPIVQPRPGFCRAVVESPSGERMKMDWAHESSFRFFPVMEDELTGYRLHWLDAATNKVLAAASREKARDSFDLLHWHGNPLSMGALIWAAVAKDPGYSPDLLLDQIIWNARLSPEDLRILRTTSPVDPVDFKRRFRQAGEEARDLFGLLPADTVGKVFLSVDGQPLEPDPGRPETLAAPFEATDRGCWPNFPDRNSLPELSGP